MKPSFTICDCSDCSIIISTDFDTLNDLIQATINRAYNIGYDDGVSDNIRAK